jgi:long-chain acyl-CoA synthetase
MAEAGMRLAHWAQVQPEVLAVQSQRGDRTFAELNANSNRLARALRARGLREGDAVAIVCSNRPEFAEVVHACLRAGLRYTPVNWHLTPDEVAYIVSDCQAKALFGDTRFAELMEKAAALSPNATVRLAIGGEIPGFEAYADFGCSTLRGPPAGPRAWFVRSTTRRVSPG